MMLLFRGISSEDDGDNTVVSFLTSGSIVGIAENRKSIVWFTRVIEAECVSENAELDDYRHSIAKGIAYMKCCFLGTLMDSANGQIFKISRKVTFFYKGSVLYPYVNFTESKKGLILSNNEYTDINHYVENNNFCHLQVCMTHTLLYSSKF